MKSLNLKIIFLTGLLAGLAMQGLTQQKKILHSTKKRIFIVEEGRSPQQWTIYPETNPDIYTLYDTKEKVKKVKFVSDIDTIEFTVKVNQRVNFMVLYNGDTAHTQIYFANKLPNDISEKDKLFSLSQLWSEAKFNFVNLDKIEFDWDSLYYAYIPQIVATKNDYDYVKLLKKFYASLHDGHTQVAGGGFSAYCDYADIYWEWLENKYIITWIRKGIAMDSSCIGAEILAISGIPIETYLRDSIFPYMSATTQQSLYLNANLTYGLKTQPFRIQVKKRNGEIKDFTLKRNGESTRTDNDENYGIEPDIDHKRVNLIWLPDSIAWLKINSFYPTEYVINELHKLEAAIGKARALIVDIRQNGGGSTDVAWKLQSYFTKQNYFLTFGSQTRVNNGYYRSQGNWREQYADYLYNRAYENFPVDTVTVSDTVPRFTMPTTILIGAYTFSAAEDFLVNMYEVPDRPIFIGEPTGGSTGAPLVIDLPNRNMYARICTIRTVFPYSKKPFCTGIEPDIVVKPTIDDYFNQKDVVLEVAVKELMKKN